jgi:hypothetical protein
MRGDALPDAERYSPIGLCRFVGDVSTNDWEMLERHDPSAVLVGADIFCEKARSEATEVGGCNWSCYGEWERQGSGMGQDAT